MGTDSTTSPSSGTQARSFSASPLTRATTASMPRSWKTRPIVASAATTCGEPSTVRRMSAMQSRLSTLSKDLDRRVHGTAEQERDRLGHGRPCLAIAARNQTVHDRELARGLVGQLERRLPSRRAALEAHLDRTDAGNVDV